MPLVSAKPNRRVTNRIITLLAAASLLLWLPGCQDGGKEFRRVLRSAARDAQHSSRRGDNPKKKTKAVKDKQSEARARLQESTHEDAIKNCPKGAKLLGHPPPKGAAQWCSAPTKDGKDVRHGEYRRWHKSGKLKVVATYKFGEYDGPYREWYGNGNSKEEAYYQDGQKHGLWATWNKDGQKRAQGQFEQGRKHGKFVYWSRKGKPEREGVFQNDVEHGVWAYYHHNGNLKARVSYLEGKKHGIVESYSNKGTLLTQESYRNDVPEGPWVAYYANGNRKATGVFADGQKHGQWVHYRRDGAVEEVTLYNAGSIVSSEAPKQQRVARGKSKRRSRFKSHVRFRNTDILGSAPPIPDTPPAQPAPPAPPKREKPQPVEKGRGWSKL